MSKIHLPPIPTLKELIRLYKLSAKKELSQNFLLDLGACRRIVKTAGIIQDASVCEVGPGPGGITRCIVEKGAKNLTVIEKDQRFMPGLKILSEAAEDYCKMNIVEGDILKYDMSQIFPKEEACEWTDPPPNLHIIGNLPFNVSTPLIVKWLEQMHNRTGAWQYGRTKLTLTFQKEVAERLVADIGSSQRSRLSIQAQYLCHVKHKYTIPGGSFVPKPKVDVGVVFFCPRKVPLIQDVSFDIIDKVVRVAFRYRRKYIIKCMETLFPPDQADLATVMLQQADIDPMRRSFELSVKEYGILSHVYKSICDSYPGLMDFEYSSSEGSKLVKEFRAKRREERQLLQAQELEKMNMEEEGRKERIPYKLKEKVPRRRIRRRVDRVLD